MHKLYNKQISDKPCGTAFALASTTTKWAGL